MNNTPVPFAHLYFSNDGKQMVAVHMDKIFVLDAFTGEIWWGCIGVYSTTC